MSKSASTWMPFFVADYQAKTSRLTLAQHGAYLLLIFDYWKNGAPPDDDAVLARILGVERRDWLKLRPVIEPFFRVEGGFWRHDRVEEEMAAAEERKAKAQMRAKAGAAGRWGDRSSGQCLEDASSTPQAMRTQCPPPSPVKLVLQPVEKAEPSVSGQAARTRGERLKPTWRPGPDHVAYAVAQGFTAEQVDRIEADFRDYWTAKSGADACKTDWAATWRRWVRNTDPRKVQGRTAQPKRVGFV